MQIVAGRIAVLFALGGAGTLWTCAPAQPPAASEPSFSITVASAAGERTTAAAPTAATDQPAEVVASPEPVGDAAATGSPRGKPIVRIGEPMVGPSYPPELIKRVLRRSTPGVRKCAEMAPSDSPRGTLTFTIETDGRVKEAAYKNGDDVVTPSFAQQCVLDAIRALEFVPPRSRITVSYPLAIDPAW